MTKTCVKCKTSKQLDCFGKSARTSDGRQSRCRTCTSEWHSDYLKRNPHIVDRIKKRNIAWYEKNKEHAKKKAREHRLNNLEMYKNTKLLKTYGITRDTYNKLLLKQSGVCAICKNPSSKRFCNGLSLAVDHDHNTGKVRGLLCSRCNTMISFFENQTDLVDSALRYLLSPPFSNL